MMQARNFQQQSHCSRLVSGVQSSRPELRSEASQGSAREVPDKYAGVRQLKEVQDAFVEAATSGALESSLAEDPALAGTPTTRHPRRFDRSSDWGTGVRSCQIELASETSFSL